jgi:hypothetical protein
MTDKYLEQDPHWVNLPYPLKPCDAEVDVYRKHLITGNTLMLGSTKQLIDICDVAVDLAPRYDHHKIIKGDWYKLFGFYENIIADGSINLTGPSLIDAVKPHCKQFISRVFSKKFPTMKYAELFYSEFPNATKIAEINESCPIFIWKFTN